MHGHDTERCWKLHPELRSKKGKEIMLHNAREKIGGKEDSPQILSDLQDKEDARREPISLGEANFG